jgi:hypothetical protein
LPTVIVFRNPLTRSAAQSRSGLRASKRQRSAVF